MAYAHSIPRNFFWKVSANIFTAHNNLRIYQYFHSCHLPTTLRNTKEGGSWTHRETYSLFLGTVQNHTTKLVRVLEHNKFQRERMRKHKSFQKTQKNRISYLEIRTTFHKMHTAFANTHLIFLVSVNTGWPQLDVNCSHMTVVSPTLCSCAQTGPGLSTLSNHPAGHGTISQKSKQYRRFQIRMYRNTRIELVKKIFNLFGC